MTNIRMCQNDVAAKKVVIIDVDSDSLNTINVDTPKCHPMKMQQGSKRSKVDKKFPSRSYIYIDDDGDDDIDDHSRDNTRFAKTKPVNLSKSKKVYPCTGLDNCYDLSMQSDGDSCDDNGDSLGMLKEEPETASLKRKTNVVIDSNKPVLNASDNDDKIGEDSVVSEREKVKDSDEYKRALEEELARELALKIQAEEARQHQNLLKRKEAEKMRLLDIERRQKQRVEEIRESQKQADENMNLKEIYRFEVQQKLKKLEMTCHDMASLLRGLGILIDNSACASSQQVHAAYKRALLSFHPDRALGSDMLQKVEAEEKFKLISRMKEKVCNIPQLK